MVYVYGSSFFSHDWKELSTYKMTVEDDHEYKLCPEAKWRKSWKDATWTDQSSDKHVTPAVKYDRALLNLLVTIHLMQKNNIFDLLGLELKASFYQPRPNLERNLSKWDGWNVLHLYRNLSRPEVMEFFLGGVIFFWKQRKNLHTFCHIQDKICVEMLK